MWRYAIVLSFVVGAGTALGHGKVTERYIPIGQSPDSQTSTLLGELAAIDTRANQLQLRSEGRLHTVTVTRDTKIWLDRSKRKVTNTSLRFTQLKPGQLGEVRCAGGVCDGDIVADWIKIEAAR